MKPVPGSAKVPGWLDAAETYLAHYFGSASEVAGIFAGAVASTTQQVASEEGLNSYFGAAGDVAELLADLVQPSSRWETRDEEQSVEMGILIPAPDATSPGEEDPLGRLPLDMLGQILSHCGARELTTVAQTGRALYHAVNCEGHWRSLWRQRYGPLSSYLGLDLDAQPLSWRCFYFEFGASWAVRAYTEKGRVLIKVRGVWHDATSMMADHPGGPDLLLASAGRDASDAFEYTDHSVRCPRA